MRFCMTCNETFADEFSFCPADGDRLRVANMKIPRGRVTSSSVTRRDPIVSLERGTQPFAGLKAKDCPCAAKVSLIGRFMKITVEIKALNLERLRNQFR